MEYFSAHFVARKRGVQGAVYRRTGGARSRLRATGPTLARRRTIHLINGKGLKG
jgi:hypothetical protein